MRILFITSWTYPHVGGVSTHMTTLAKELRERNHEVSVIGINDLKTDPAYSYISSVESRRHAICRFLSSVAGERRPDVIHFHDCFAASAAIDITLPAPAVLTCHGYTAREAVSAGLWKEDSLEYDYVTALERRAYRAMDRVIAPDSCIAAYVEQIAGIRPLVLYNFVDTDMFAPTSDGDKKLARIRLGLPQSSIIALCPRRLCEKNGVRFAVEAMAFVRAGAHLVVVGDGEERQAIEEQVVRRRLQDRVIMMGATMHIKPFYDAADLVIIPSITSAGVEEATSIAALEAMGCGLPVVCTGVGGLGELFRDGDAALVVPQRDPRAIAEAIDTLARDPELRSRLGRAGRGKVLNLHSARNATSTILNLYRELVQSEGSGRVFASFVRDGGNKGPGRAQAETARHSSAFPGIDYHQVVLTLRRREYEDRVRRLRDVPQQLAAKSTPPSSLHVVYLMAQVGVSGGAKVIFQHANHLRESGVHVTIVSHFPKPGWYPISADYVQVPFQTELARGIPDCDVIVATYWDQIHACVETGIAPVVYFEQGDFHLFDAVKPETYEVVRRQIQLAPFVAAVSGAAANMVKARYGRDARVFPNGLDPSFFLHDDRPVAVQRKPYLLMMGNESWGFKGTADVIRAYELVRGAGYDVELVWVAAQPPTRPAGTVYVRPEQHVLRDLYRGATVFVSGSRYEAFSLPPLEAMACGCPVVTAANAGVLEYAVDGQNCLLAEIDNPQSLAEQIMRLLDEPQLRERVSRGGLETANRYRWENIIPALRGFYEEVAEFEPVARNSIEEWEIDTALFSDPDRVARLLAKPLLHAEADTILAPIIYDDLVEKHPVARWEIVARQKRPRYGRNYQVLTYIAAERDPVLPYREAYESFSGGRYEDALARFICHFRQSTSKEDKAIYARWIALCLIELGRDEEALKVLTDAVGAYPENTDLLYLYGLALGLSGRDHGENALIEAVLSIRESTAFPEFFCDIGRRVLERLPVR